MESPDNLPADNDCQIPVKVFIPGLCPECGADVQIDWKKCKECSAILG